MHKLQNIIIIIIIIISVCYYISLKSLYQYIYTPTLILSLIIAVHNLKSFSSSNSFVNADLKQYLI
jgi:hypothetical protein